MHCFVVLTYKEKENITALVYEVRQVDDYCKYQQETS